MKGKITLLCLLFITIAHSQITEIQFDYDVAGNQIKRSFINVSDRPASNDSIKKIEDLVEEDLIKSDIYEDIQYYPNPVREQLFVKWTLLEDRFVERIDLYSVSGQLLTSIKNLSKVNSTSVYFSSYPEGMYNLVLLYSDSEQKTLKVIKK